MTMIEQPVRRDFVGFQNNKSLRFKHKRFNASSNKGDSFPVFVSQKRRRIDGQGVSYLPVDAQGTKVRVNHQEWRIAGEQHRSQKRKIRRNRKHFKRPRQTSLHHILGVPTHSVQSNDDLLLHQINALQNILELVKQPVPQPQPVVSTQPIEWSAALLDPSSSLLGAVTVSLPSSFAGHSLSDELFIRETSNKSLWRHLKNIPSTPFSRVVFVPNGEHGAQFRAALWKFRKAAVVNITEGWEMHISAESMNEEDPLIGYICPAGHPWALAQTERDNLKKSRKLAAAIDIDDTLLRLIRYDDSHKYPSNRIKCLPMFTPASSSVNAHPEWVVALSSSVEQFLEEASKYYKLCPYSVGIPKYVQEVAELLDPEHKYFDWDVIEEGLSSARHEHDGGDTSPKRFERVFTFPNRAQDEVDYELCVAVDDSSLAWHAECRARVIDPRPAVGVDGIWDSNLLNALEVLTTIHSEYYNTNKLL